MSCDHRRSKVVATYITPARKFRMLLHINPTRQRGKRTGSLAGASGWYMTFFAAGVIYLQWVAAENMALFETSR